MGATIQPALPGLGIPPRNIFCIGRNYAEHAKELKNEIPSEPVVFLKPTSSLVFSGGKLKLPPQSSRVDHEVEIVVAIGKEGGSRIPPERALEWVAGYAVGIDFTARDLQDKAKAKALPWAIAKGFDTFAALSEFAPASRVSDSSRLELELKVNGELRQKGSAEQMLFPIPQLIAFLSGIFTLAPGDLIYTGTPAGVGPLKSGDRIEASLSGPSGDLCHLELASEAASHLSG